MKNRTEKKQEQAVELEEQVLDDVRGGLVDRFYYLDEAQRAYLALRQELGDPQPWFNES